MTIFQRAILMLPLTLPLIHSPLDGALGNKIGNQLFAAQNKEKKVYTNDDPLFAHPPEESRREVKDASPSVPPATAPRRTGEKLAPFVPSPMEVVDKMLEAAEVTSRDVVYDLGSGDGRIVIRAAQKYGARAVGIELDRRLVEESQEKVRESGVGGLVTITLGDILETSLKGSTVVTVYLLPIAIEKLRPIFERDLTPGTRVVSHDMRIPRWLAAREETITIGSVLHTVYLYQIPGAIPK